MEVINMEYIINQFIKELTTNLVDENKDREYDCDKKQLNIPFIIATLIQHLNDKEFESFLTDIKGGNYNIRYEDISDGYYEYGKIIVSLYEFESINDEHYYSDNNDYEYSIVLLYDQRDWGYCQCEPYDKDYREDKGCCGHGCDWWAPAFRIVKVISIGTQKNWNGDEHDYWDFEDSFYKSDKELAEEKEKRDKEEKIKHLQENIRVMQERLDELLHK
jgi:hypothetical protein